MSNDTLRGLSRSYSAGAIDREAYKAQRRDLLDGIVADPGSLVAFTPPEPEARTVFPYDEDDGDTTQEIMPDISIRSASSSSLIKSLIIGGVVVLVILAGIALYLMRPMQAEGDRTPATVSTPQEVESATLAIDGHPQITPEPSKPRPAR